MDKQKECKYHEKYTFPLVALPVITDLVPHYNNLASQQWNLQTGKNYFMMFCCLELRKDNGLNAPMRLRTIKV